MSRLTSEINSTPSEQNPTSLAACSKRFISKKLMSNGSVIIVGEPKPKLLVEQKSKKRSKSLSSLPTVHARTPLNSKGTLKSVGFKDGDKKQISVKEKLHKTQLKESKEWLLQEKQAQIQAKNLLEVKKIVVGLKKSKIRSSKEGSPHFYNLMEKIDDTLFFGENFFESKLVETEYLDG